MLRSSSHLTEACGQSHYKKFWLLQTQTDSQENCIAVSSPASLSFPAALLKGSDGKLSGIPSARGFAADLPSQGRAVWSTVGSSEAGFRGVSGGHRSNTSLSTCAESLTHPQLDATVGLFRLPSEGHLCADMMDANDRSLEVVEPRRSGLCVSHSSCVSSSPSLYGFADQLHSESLSRETGFVEFANPLLDIPRGNDPAAAIPSVQAVGDSVTATPFVRDISENYTLSAGSDSSLQVEPFSDDSTQEIAVKSADGSGCMSSNFQRPVESNVFFAQNFTEPNGDGHLGRDSRPVCVKQREDIVVELPGECTGRNVLRTCKLCGTAKTPLWRSGPLGPKSLCNACGIPYKKLRKSQVAGDSSFVEASPSSTNFATRPLKRKSASEKDFELVRSRSRQRFKRTVVRKNNTHKVEDAGSCLTSPDTTPPRRQATLMMRRNSEQKVSDVKLNLLESVDGLTTGIAADVKEAAILLMALSCGLVLE